MRERYGHYPGLQWEAGGFFRQNQDIFVSSSGTTLPGGGRRPAEWGDRWSLAAGLAAFRRSGGERLCSPRPWQWYLIGTLGVP